MARRRRVNSFGWPADTEPAATAPGPAPLDAGLPAAPVEEAPSHPPPGARAAALPDTPPRTARPGPDPRRSSGEGEGPASSGEDGIRRMYRRARSDRTGAGSVSLTTTGCTPTVRRTEPNLRAGQHSNAERLAKGGATGGGGATGAGGATGERQSDWRRRSDARSGQTAGGPATVGSGSPASQRANASSTATSVTAQAPSAA